MSDEEIELGLFPMILEGNLSYMKIENEIHQHKNGTLQASAP